MKTPSRDMMQVRDFFVLLLLYLTIVTSFITCKKETLTHIRSLSQNVWHKATGADARHLSD